jgi:hypothetical protein
MVTPMTTPAQWQVWKRAALSAVIAYALVLQAVLVAFTGAAHAGKLREPLAVLCHQDGAQAPRDSGDAPHHGLCCILGASAAIAAGGSPVTGGSLQEPPVTATAVVFAPAWSFLANAASFLPVGSRAPPRLG